MFLKLRNAILLHLFVVSYCSFIYPIPLPIVASLPKIQEIKIPDQQYSFSYDVNDPNTGDSKSQTETRSGAHVLGRYAVLQPDGIRRIVDYKADPYLGFTADVKNELEKTGEAEKILEAKDKMMKQSGEMVRLQTESNGEAKTEEKTETAVVTANNVKSSFVSSISSYPRNILYAIHTPHYIWY